MPSPPTPEPPSSGDEQTRFLFRTTVRTRLVAAAVVIGVVLFTVSLFFDAARFERVDKSSVEMLALGWLGPLGYHVGWYANPLLVLTWVVAFVPRRLAALGALALSVLVLLVGLTSFYTLVHGSLLGRNEGESAGDLLSFGPGIYLWTASLATGSLAALVSLVLAPRPSAP